MRPSSYMIVLDQRGHRTETDEDPRADTRRKLWSKSLRENVTNFRLWTSSLRTVRRQISCKATQFVVFVNQPGQTLRRTSSKAKNQENTEVVTGPQPELGKSKR